MNQYIPYLLVALAGFLFNKGRQAVTYSSNKTLWSIGLFLGLMFVVTLSILSMPPKERIIFQLAATILLLLNAIWKSVTLWLSLDAIKQRSYKYTAAFLALSSLVTLVAFSFYLKPLPHLLFYAPTSFSWNTIGAQIGLFLLPMIIIRRATEIIQHKAFKR